MGIRTGLNFSSNCSFHQSQLNISQQANKAIFVLHKKLSSYKTLSISVVIDLFEKFIVPILNYGSESWGFHDAPDIEKVQLRFYKRILGVKGTTQNDFIYGILGRVPMLIIRHCNIVKYWTNIILGKKSAYVNLLYTSMLQTIDNRNNNNWAHNVRNLLCSNGFGDIWRDQCVFDQEGFNKAFKQRLFDIFKQNWSFRLSESTRASFYRVIIGTHAFQNILDTVNANRHRIALTRLICSSHRLSIETGRWRRPQIPRHERKCAICHKLGDEFHFLLECQVHNENRIKFIKPYYRRNPSMFKCIQLLTSTNKKELRNLAKYVYLCFQTNST